MKTPEDIIQETINMIDEINKKDRKFETIMKFLVPLILAFIIVAFIIFV